ncbi:MAG: hypothetical protein KKH28_00025 [Elusimicrobia bacterium]|nr:hypothetical protein [Elusimicrobiota bacterium]
MGHEIIEQIKQAYINWASSLDPKRLSYLLFVQHFEERWVQVELAHHLSLVLKNPNVWMEAKKYDIGVYSSVNEKKPAVLIELKTVKNYDLSYWTSRFPEDIKKLKAARLGASDIRCFFMVISAFAEPAEPKENVFWFNKAITPKSEYETQLNTKFSLNRPGAEKLFKDPDGFFKSMSLTMYLQEIF